MNFKVTKCSQILFLILTVLKRDFYLLSNYIYSHTVIRF